METPKKKSNYVLCYTREPQDDAVYSEKLAYSMHLALSEDGTVFQELNHNSGILFAKATQNEDGTLNAKSLKKPYLFETKDGNYGVIAIRTEADGSDDEQSRGKILYFETRDLLQYEEKNLIELKQGAYIEDAICNYDVKKMVYIIHWRDKEGNYYLNEARDLQDTSSISQTHLAEDSFSLKGVQTQIVGAVSRNVIAVPEETAHRIKCKLTVPENIRIELPECVRAKSIHDLDNVKAVAWYSDGTSSEKKVDWYTENIQWDVPDTYRIEGFVHQDHYEFPVAFNRADPCIGKWKGKYYFTATNDTDGYNSLYIREADSIPQLVTAQEHKIIDTTMYPHLKGLLWAPEFHIIKDKFYIFHAGTPKDFEDEQSHVMALKDNGRPVKTSDWERPLRVIKKDGSPLFEAGITLDMTIFEVKGRFYAGWSQRQFVPVDQGAWLYIAEVNPDEPWKLITDPVLISMPEYGWANNHTFVDEGPYALIKDQKIFLTFSSAAIDSTYVVGILSAELGADLLEPKSWKKGNYPLLTSSSVHGQYGPGHNAYVEDDDGNIWSAYHARPDIDAPRSSGIRRVHFDIDGFPVLNLTEEKDLSPELAYVSMDVIVPNDKSE